MHYDVLLLYFWPIVDAYLLRYAARLFVLCRYVGYDIDLTTAAKFKVDLLTKANNGLAL